MDFGDILDEWDRKSSKPGGLKGADEAERRLREGEAARLSSLAAEDRRRAAERNRAHVSMETWIAEHGVEDKDAGRKGRDPDDESGEREAEARRLKALRPEARIDLHGMSASDAEAALETFLETAARQGLEKVLVVTGKGMHSKSEPVLGRASRRVLERSPHAGRFGEAEAADGGRGALWVLIRKRIISRDI